jgi:hypothetical protein
LDAEQAEQDLESVNIPTLSVSIDNAFVLPLSNKSKELLVYLGGLVLLIKSMIKGLLNKVFKSND